MPSTKSFFAICHTHIVIWGAIAIILVCCQGCNQSEDLLMRQIKKFAADHEISCEEWESLDKFIVNKQISKYLNNAGQLDTIALQQLISSNQQGDDIEYCDMIVGGGHNMPVSIKFFLENSGSMDGYVKGATVFESALMDFLTDVTHHFDKENLKISFINTGVHPAQYTDIDDFIEELEPIQGKSYIVGNRSTSELNKILKMVLDSTDEQTISVLVSDCIYDTEQSDMDGQLNRQKYTTKDYFSERCKKSPISAVVVKLISEFVGTYYFSTSGSTFLNGKRPFYMWVIASPRALKTFLKKIDLKKIQGYEDSFVMLPSEPGNTPFYSLLYSTTKKANIGEFERDRDEPKGTFHHLKNVRLTNGQFEFKVAVNFEDINIDPKYFEDTNNYQLDEGFSLVKAERISSEKVEGNDWASIMAKKPTHLLTVNMRSQALGVKTLSIRLLKKIPSWVERSNSPSDLNIQAQESQTFGISYLIGGVYEAFELFNGKDNYYANLTFQFVK